MTIITIMARAPISMRIVATQERSWLIALLTRLPRPCGKRLTMLANRMMEIPFPMPNSVICSPSHMTSAEPAVKVITMTMAAQTAGASDTMIPLRLISK